MSFGPIIRFTVSDIKIELAPLTKQSVQEFIVDGGLQTHSVHRYLTTTAQVAEDEDEWFEKTRVDKASITWGIWDISDGRKLIGSSALHGIGGETILQATSGSLIFRPEYWGKGIASAAHKARTWYGFNQLGLTRIKSGVLDGNVGSWKALERSGYTLVYIERNEKFVDGRYVDQLCLECINPDPIRWTLWWGTRRPTRKALEARKRTRNALSWAEDHVSLA